MFDIMESTFSGLETEHQRISTLTESDFFIPLKSYNIGIDERRVRIDGNLVRHPVQLNGQYISIKRVLKIILNNQVFMLLSKEM